MVHSSSVYETVLDSEDANIAPVGRRIGAGLFDAVMLTALAVLLSLLPLRFGGLALPMLGSFVALLMWTVFPISHYKATLGLRIFGLQLTKVDGSKADAIDLLFRELVGRGYIANCYLATVAFGTFGRGEFFAPGAIGLALGFLSALLLVFSMISHLMVLTQKDHRGFHDLMTKTIVVVRKPPVKNSAGDDDVLIRSSLESSPGKSLFLFELVSLAIGLGVPYVFSRPSIPSAPSYTERAPVEPKNDFVAGYRAVLEKDACNKEVALKLGDELNRNDRFQEAIEHVDGFIAKCGPFPRLLWVSFYSQQQLGNPRAAIAIGTQLIENRPRDSDFWWWRADEYRKAGETGRAESDYRHSMAMNANGFAAGRFAEMVKATKPCEGAFAIRAYMNSQEDEDLDGWESSMLQDLHLAGNCERMEGVGKTSVVLGDRPAMVSAKVNGTGGKFVVYDSAYVTLTRAFAERAGIAIHDEKVPVHLAGQFVEAHLAKVSSIALGRARANDVEVAIVDDLPGEVDGYLGLSFTWRFSLHKTKKGIELEGR